MLREVLAVADGKPRPAFSTLFSAELQVIGVPSAEHIEPNAPVLPVPSPAEVAAGLPVPAVDSDDPAAGFLATLSTLEPSQRIRTLASVIAGQQGIPPAVTESAETRLALARALIVGGDAAGATPVLAAAAAADPGDWRIRWYQGLRDLAAGDPATARSAFDTVLDALPGELAAKLALGLAAESAGDPVTAGRFLQLVWTVDRSFVSAAFGLGRIRLAAGDRAGAIAALTAVPATSSLHVAAQVAAVRIRLQPPPGQTLVSADDLQEADRQLGKLRLDAAARQRLTAEVLQAALNRVLAGQPLGGGLLLGSEPHERSLRFGLETSYRAQARLAPDATRRIELVDLANQVRPRTWS